MNLGKLIFVVIGCLPQFILFRWFPSSLFYALQHYFFTFIVLKCPIFCTFPTHAYSFLIIFCISYYTTFAFPYSLFITDEVLSLLSIIRPIMCMCFNTAIVLFFLIYCLFLVCSLSVLRFVCTIFALQCLILPSCFFFSFYFIHSLFLVLL